jgi:hypothetical protein
LLYYWGFFRIEKFYVSISLGKGVLMPKIIESVQDAPKECENCHSEDVGKPVGIPYIFCYSCGRLLDEIKQENGTDRTETEAVVKPWKFTEV